MISEMTFLLILFMTFRDKKMSILFHRTDPFVVDTKPFQIEIQRDPHPVLSSDKPINLILVTFLHYFRR